MKKISAEIVADSICNKHRITSMLLTFPRFILAELNTHRMFSRNSASSRAIPFEKMVKMVEEDPFIPIAFQKDHKGMQGTEYLTGDELEEARDRWNDAKNYALSCAKDLHYTDTTKQLCNRLLEPFMWHTVLVTATEWDNFFELRCPKYEYLGEEFRSKKDAINSYTFEVGFEKERLYLTSLTELDWIKLSKSGAEIHIQALAEAMWDAMNESTPRLLQSGEWHLPFGDLINEQEILNSWAEYTYPDNMAIKETMSFIKRKITTARCARISYATFDNMIDYKKDIKLHNNLLDSGHFSPFEHCARAMTLAEYETFIKGKLSLNEFLIEVNKEHAGWCNNFKGFIPYRYMIENNYD